MSEIDFDERELCPDGACIGVIGKDGKCTVCGLAGEKGASASDGDTSEADADSGSDLQSDSDDNSSSAESSSAESSSDSSSESDSSSAADADRELCPDGACIGVLDANGKCKICGAVRPGIAP